jgi:hypothetical protein
MVAETEVFHFEVCQFCRTAWSSGYSYRLKKQRTSCPVRFLFCTGSS